MVKVPHDDLLAILKGKVFGQDESIAKIVERVQIFDTHLSPEGRPAGVFLLLGPTGTGKTKTVEALAESLHGSPKKMIKVDCGEFQMEHEIAKLIGAPPGYLGHRETQPLISQIKLNTVTSNYSAISILLFDEIEKAAPSMSRLLLGILDKATLHLGDNSVVNFESTFIFLTSNLGARAMQRSIGPSYGFPCDVDVKAQAKKVRNLGIQALRKKYSPEFINRIDDITVYAPLDHAAVMRIVDAELNALQDLITKRLGDKMFLLSVDSASKRYLLKRGVSAEYGAREMKRLIHREIVQPVARLVSAGVIPARGVVEVTRSAKGLSVKPKETLLELQQRLKDLIAA